MSVVNSYLSLMTNPLYEYNKFVYSPIDEHLCYFQYLVMKNKTGLNSFVHICIKIY